MPAVDSQMSFTPVSEAQLPAAWQQQASHPEEAGDQESEGRCDRNLCFKDNLESGQRGAILGVAL